MDTTDFHISGKRRSQGVGDHSYLSCLCITNAHACMHGPQLYSLIPFAWMHGDMLVVCNTKCNVLSQLLLIVS